MLKLIRRQALLIPLSLCAAVAGHAHAADLPRADATVVLVHGAFADGSSWDKVIPLLQDKNIKVVSVQNPLTSLADDVAATRRVLDAQTGKVVLVGHSWGGTVITEAGNDDKVKALVYVAAFAPGEGEATGDLGKNLPPPPGIATLQVDKQGFASVPEASMIANFAQDLPQEKVKLMTATQAPIQVKAFGEKVTHAAWRTKKNYYIVSADDRMIQPDLERAMAQRINAATTVLPGSHVSLLSHPREVADVIIKAAAQQ